MSHLLKTGSNILTYNRVLFRVKDKISGIYISHPGYSGSQCFAIDESNNKIYIPNGSNVKVLSLTTLDVVATISGFSGAMGCAIDNVNNRLFVCNNSSDTIRIIDLSTYTQTGIFNVPTDPHSIALDMAGSRIIITSGSNIYLYDISTHALITTLTNLTEVVGLAVDNTTNRLFVTNPHDAVIYVFDLTDMSLSATINGAIPGFSQPRELSINYESNELLVGCLSGLAGSVGGIVFINLSSLAMTSYIPRGSLSGIWCGAKTATGRLFALNGDYLTELTRVLMT